MDTQGQVGSSGQEAPTCHIHGCARKHEGGTGGEQGERPVRGLVVQEAHGGHANDACDEGVRQVILSKEHLQG